MKRSQWQNAETILYAPPVRRPAILLLLQQVKRVPLKTVRARTNVSALPP